MKGKWQKNHHEVNRWLAQGLNLHSNDCAGGRLNTSLSQILLCKCSCWILAPTWFIRRKMSYAAMNGYKYSWDLYNKVHQFSSLGHDWPLRYGWMFSSLLATCRKYFIHWRFTESLITIRLVWDPESGVPSSHAQLSHMMYCLGYQLKHFPRQ